MNDDNIYHHLYHHLPDWRSSSHLLYGSLFTIVLLFILLYPLIILSLSSILWHPSFTLWHFSSPFGSHLPSMVSLFTLWHPLSPLGSPHHPMAFFLTLCTCHHPLAS